MEGIGTEIKCETIRFLVMRERSGCIGADNLVESLVESSDIRSVLCLFSGGFKEKIREEAVMRIWSEGLRTDEGSVINVLCDHPLQTPLLYSKN